MLPSVENLLLEQDGDTLTIWFNRPESRNALSTAMADELAAVLEALPKEPFRFVILRGKGGTFCSGGDLKMFKNVFQAGAQREEIVGFNAEFGRTMAAIRALPQLFIVLIEGAAMAADGNFLPGRRGANNDISTLCTDRGHTRHSPAQITPVVIKRIGASQARRLLLTAQRFTAEALELGFAHYAEDDIAAVEARLADILADARRGAPNAIALTKQIINASFELRDDDLVQFAAERFADAMLGDEAGEGMQAFAEKRPTSWSERHKRRMLRRVEIWYESAF